jgi:hypothetical protein
MDKCGGFTIRIFIATKVLKANYSHQVNVASTVQTPDN